METLLLPIAIICLWAPGAIMASARIKSKLRQGSRRNHEGMSSLLRCGLNWFDLGRAVLGAWLLQRYVGSLHNLDQETQWIPLALQISILSVGTLAQVIWFDQKLSIIGPVFYLAGVTMVVCGPLVGGFSLVLAIDCALMFRTLGSCFLFGPVCVAFFAAIFHRLGILSVLNAGLLALPVVFAFASGSRVAFVRSPRRVRKVRAPRPKPAAQSTLVFDGGSHIPEKEMVVSRNSGSFESTPPILPTKAGILAGRRP